MFVTTGFILIRCYFGRQVKSLEPSFSIACHAERLPLHPDVPRRAPRRGGATPGPRVPAASGSAPRGKSQWSEPLERVRTGLRRRREACVTPTPTPTESAHDRHLPGSQADRRTAQAQPRRAEGALARVLRGRAT